MGCYSPVHFHSAKCWLQFLLWGDGLKTKCSDCLKTILSSWLCLFYFVKVAFLWYCLQVQIHHSDSCVPVWDGPSLNWGITTFKSAALYMAKRGSDPDGVMVGLDDLRGLFQP